MKHRPTAECRHQSAARRNKRARWWKQHQLNRAVVQEDERRYDEEKGRKIT